MLGRCELSVLLAAFCLAAAPATAQTAPVLTLDEFRSVADVTAGVSVQGPADVNQRPACEILSLPCLSPQTFPGLGFALSARIYAIDTAAIVGEFSAYPDPWAVYDPACDRRHSVCAVNQTNHVRSALAGLELRTRLIASGTSRWRLFGQVLAGPQWTDIGPRQNVIQPGAGADDYLRNGLIVHVEYAYRFAPDLARDLSTGRFLVGLGIPLGSR